MLERAAIEKKVAEDFDKFDSAYFADKPMEKYCAYHCTKHIQMATQLVINYIEATNYVTNYLTAVEVDDFIHGLNHVFFNGVGAGQCFEWSKEREKNEG